MTINTQQLRQMIRQSTNGIDFDQINLEKAYLYRVNSEGQLEQVTNIISKICFWALNAMHFRTSATVLNKWAPHLKSSISVFQYHVLRELNELNELREKTATTTIGESSVEDSYGKLGEIFSDLRQSYIKLKRLENIVNTALTATNIYNRIVRFPELEFDADPLMESLRERITEIGDCFKRLYIREFEIRREVTLREDSKKEEADIKRFLDTKMAESKDTTTLRALLPSFKKDIHRQLPLVLNGRQLTGDVAEGDRKGNIEETYDAMRLQVETDETDPERRLKFIDIIQVLSGQGVANVFDDYAVVGVGSLASVREPDGGVLRFGPENQQVHVNIIKTEDGHIDRIAFEYIMERKLGKDGKEEDLSSEMALSMYCEVTVLEDGSIKVENIDCRFADTSTQLPLAPVLTREKHPGLFQGEA